LVSVDEGLRCDTERHRACVSGLCDYFAFHPARNDPCVETPRGYRRARYMGTPAFFDEMIAFASEQNLNDFPILRGKGTIALFGRGTEQERWEIANRLYNMAIEEGISPCWHSISTIRCIKAPSEMRWPNER
jgi:hypothetical protein